MPFRLFQRWLSLVLLLGMLGVQAPLLPFTHTALMGIAFTLCTATATSRLGWFVTGTMEALLLALLLPALLQGEVLTSILLFNGLMLMGLLGFNPGFKSYFALFVLSLTGVLLSLLQLPHLGLPQLVGLFVYLYLFVLHAFGLLLRHDIEHHHIIKHRLGRESRRVEVGRLLNSKRVLDKDLAGFVFFFSGLTVVLALLFVLLVLPFFPMTGITTRRRPRFPAHFDLNRLGRISVDQRSRVQVKRLGGGPPFRGRFYLRGRVMEQYARGIWFPKQDLIPSVRPLESAATIYRIETTLPSAHGFAPSGTLWVRAGSKGCRLTTYRTVLVDHPKRGSSCIMGANHTALEDVGDTYGKNGLGSIPSGLQRLAQKLGSGLSTPTEKMKAVGAHLSSLNYHDSYQGGGEGDPVERFLFQSRKGPCGLFASAAVLLLRAMDVKARLVLGFSRKWERGESLTMRGRDAHSWAEVYLPGVGWKIWDPTATTRFWVAPKVKAPTRQRFSVMVGSILALALVITLLLFWIIRRNRSTVVPAAGGARAPRRGRPPSQTTYRASLLFTEIIGAPPFAAQPRRAGESAHNYAERLEAQGHPRAGVVLEAASCANLILFAGLDQEARGRHIERLEELLKTLRDETNVT